MKKPLLVSLGLGVIFIAVLLTINNSRQINFPKGETKVLPTEAPPNEDRTKNRLEKSHSVANSGKSIDQDHRSKSAHDYLMLRAGLAARFSGDELFREQRKLTESAVTSLNDIELLEFYKGLFSQGGGGMDFNWALSVGLGRVFGHGKDKEIFDWISNEPNKILQDKILYYAGQSYYGSDFNLFYEKISDPNSKSKLLSGYCSQIAITDLPEAISTYLMKSPKGLDYSSLKDVFNRCGPDADYLAAHELIPADSRQIASEIRATLFQKWAESAPQKAAELIISGDQRISIEQLKPVMQKWFESDSVGAISWGTSLTPSKQKDVCLQSLSQSLSARDPNQAWDVAKQISDPSTREAALKSVHNSWIKLDPEKAEAAKEEIIPKKH